MIRALTVGWVIPLIGGWFPHRRGAHPLTGDDRFHYWWRLDPLTVLPCRSLRGVGPSPPSPQHAAPHAQAASPQPWVNLTAGPTPQVPPCAAPRRSAAAGPHTKPRWGGGEEAAEPSSWGRGHAGGAREVPGSPCPR